MSAPSSVRSLHRLAAFTLLELLGVLGVVAVLTGLLLGLGPRVSTTGKIARARAELTALGAALDAYKLAHGDFPRTDDPARFLQALIGKRGPDYQAMHARGQIEVARFTTEGSLDPHLNESVELLDPWEQPYRYAYKSQVPWTNPSFILYSSGPDGAYTVALLSGGFPDKFAAGNSDNLYAD